MDTWAIITGLLAAVATFLPGVTSKLRAYGIIGGLLFAAYGLYVASQTSGTFYFSVYGFLLPVLIIGSAIKESLNKSHPPTPLTRAIVAQPTKATQTISYSGPRFCTNHDCRFQGARTELLQCSECGFQTRLINGYGGSTAVVEEPERTKLAEVIVPATGLSQNVAGVRFCTCEECTQRGVRTELAQCPECRFQTRLIATYGGSTQIRD